MLFLDFQRLLQKKEKKGDAARFLDARGDEKQVLNLERPNSVWIFMTWLSLLHCRKKLLENGFLMS